MRLTYSIELYVNLAIYTKLIEKLVDVEKNGITNKYGVKSFISHHQQVFEMFQQAYIEGISNYTVKVAGVPRISIISLIVCSFKL